MVDLGCGTGLSTRAWSGRSARTVGVDSNPSMLRLARRAPGVDYRLGSSSHTGIRSGSADIVTCSQSLHWMPPRSTLREVARVLRRGGVFAAYDYVVPPLIEPGVDRAFTSLLRWAGLPALPEEKAGHASRLARCGWFRWTGEVSVHGQDWGDAQRAIDLALSLGHVAARLPRGEASEERHWKAFYRAVRQSLGHSRTPFWWSYTVNLAVK